jgi:hypothetical protein
VCSEYDQNWYGGHLWCETGGYAVLYCLKNCDLHSILSDGQLPAKLDLVVCNAYESLLPQILFFTLLAYEEERYLVLMKTPIFTFRLNIHANWLYKGIKIVFKTGENNDSQEDHNKEHY